MLHFITLICNYNERKGGIKMDPIFLMNSLWVMLSAILVILMIGGFILP